jgi:antitoxin (DNA-binding transcriptional repressor) of toxin-antitoxin stability system
MKEITTHYAKTHLSKLLKEVQKGESVVILHGSTPVGRLTAVTPKAMRSRPRVGTVTSAPVNCATDAFAPLEGEELKTWGL